MAFTHHSESPLADFLRNLAPQILVLSPAILMLRALNVDQFNVIELLKALVLLILAALWAHMAWTNAANYAASTAAPLHRLRRHGGRHPVRPTDREPTGALMLWRHIGQLWRTDRRECLHLLITPIAIGSGLAIVVAAAWNAAALIVRSS